MTMNAKVPSLYKLAMTHIVKRCKRLYQNDDIEGFGVFWTTIPRPIQLKLSKKEWILIARAQFCFHIGDYTEITLQMLWWMARYEEAKLKGSYLIHEIRRKFPCPRTIMDWKLYNVLNKELKNQYSYIPPDMQPTEVRTWLQNRRELQRRLEFFKMSLEDSDGAEFGCHV